MPSRIITPPDLIANKKNLLIINATSPELATLILWLKTVPDQFDIHLYHSRMTETNWAIEVAESAETILVSKENYRDLNTEIINVLNSFSDRVVYFGLDSDYPDLIQYFLTKKEFI